MRRGECQTGRWARQEIIGSARDNRLDWEHKVRGIESRTKCLGLGREPFETWLTEPFVTSAVLEDRDSCRLDFHISERGRQLDRKYKRRSNSLDTTYLNYPDHTHSKI